MWNKPQSYREGLVIDVGLLVVDILLQVAVEAINWSLFACPINVTMLMVYTIALAAMHLLRKRVYLFGWLSHYSAAVSSLVWVVGVIVIIGPIRQVPSGHASNDTLGFSQIALFWTSILLYFWMVTALGLAVLRVNFPSRIDRLSFPLNYVRLFVALTTATLGSADMQCLKVATRMGDVEWRTTDNKGKLIELPLAIKLKDFTIDEYPPKLMLIGNETEGVLSEKSPVYLLLEDGISEDSLLDRDLFVEQPIPMAASVAIEDTLKSTDLHPMGATYAAYLKTVNRENQQVKEEWVGYSNFLFPYRVLRLDSLTSLMVPEREPRRLTSEVKVYTQGGAIAESAIEVNRPMGVAGWKTYQLSYDESKGRWNGISVFELVRDPWLPIVYAGIIMIMLGTICLFVDA